MLDGSPLLPSFKSHFVLKLVSCRKLKIVMEPIGLVSSYGLLGLSTSSHPIGRRILFMHLYGSGLCVQYLLNSITTKLFRLMLLLYSHFMQSISLDTECFCTRSMEELTRPNRNERQKI